MTLGLLQKSDLPCGESGAWKISRFEVSDADAKLFNLRAAFHRDCRTIKAGTYSRLMRGGHVVMSDTPSEMNDHRAPVANAKGVCLINGLGLGMVAEACLRKPEVDRVIVVELSLDVIALVAPHLQERWGDRLNIIEGDAFNYQPPKGQMYQMVWHDIWDDITSDNLDGMKRLVKKYARRTTWQGCWARQECEELRRRWG